MATEFCTVAHNICWSLVWALLHFTFLVPRILGLASRFLESVCIRAEVIQLFQIQLSSETNRLSETSERIGREGAFSGVDNAPVDPLHGGLVGQTSSNVYKY